MKTLDDAVVEQQGEWFDNDFCVALIMKNDMKTIVLDNAKYAFADLAFFCTRDQFQQRAKELGFVGKYRWGVEYPTKGKKPELADDVVVKCRVSEVWCISEGPVDMWPWRFIGSFRITDQRYKPEDTSYLYKSTYRPIKSADDCLLEHLAHTKTTNDDYAAEFERVTRAGKERFENELAAIIVEGAAKQIGSAFDVLKSDDSNWFDYEAQKAVALPKAGEYCQVYLNGWYNCYIVGLDDLGGCVFRKDGEYMQRITDDSFRPLDWNRKAEAEKNRVVTAVYADLVKAGCILSNLNSLYKLYDLGYLRLPTNKD
jgi:hypothetical protein